MIVRPYILVFGARQGQIGITIFFKGLSCFLRQHDNKMKSTLCKPWLVPTMVNGLAIWNRGYQWLTGLSHGTYWCIWAEVKDKVIYKVHGNQCKLKGQRSTVNASAALKQIFEDNALPQPHLQQTMPDGSALCQHHLPLGMTKKDVLETINKTLQDREESKISSSTLYKIWCGQFCNVKTPSKKRMSKCKVCDELKNAIEHSKCKKLREGISNGGQFIYVMCMMLEYCMLLGGRKPYQTWRSQCALPLMEWIRIQLLC